MLVVLGLLAVLFWAVLPLGDATDKRERAQVAADAAALAGVEAIRADVIDLFVGGFRSVTDIRDLLSCGAGRDEALGYARRNDASVVSYCYYWTSGLAEVTVRGDRPGENGSYPRASATARMRADWTRCRVDGAEPAPTRPRTPTPSPSPSPTPPSDQDVQLRCGSFVADFTLRGTSGLMVLDTPQSVVRARLEPVLAS
jgi:hypothetical protein